MKITTTGPRPAAVGRRPAAGGSGGAHGAGFALPAGGRSGAAGAAPAVPLTSLAGLLAVQEVGAIGGGDGRRRAVRRGHDLLDRLDELRLALLDGRLPEPAVRGIAAVLDEEIELVEDPRLRATLEEVELRAAVELAKLERAWSGASGADAV